MEISNEQLPEPFRYQIYTRGKVAARKRTAVIAPPGSGKTRPIIEGVNDLGGFQGLVIILCSGSAIAAWTRQIPLWSRCPEYRDFIHVVTGNKGDRMDLWEQAAHGGFGTYITNFSCFWHDFGTINQIKWGTAIADEYHKVMRNHKISKVNKKKIRVLKTYGMFKKMTLHTPILVLATGSLVRRNASSMFTAFQLSDPKRFSSYWKFVNTYCHIDDSSFGQRVYGVKNAENLRKIMDQYFAYIPPEVVADSLPEGRRYGIDVSITKEQAEVYQALEKEMIAIAGDDIIITPTVLGKMTAQRQLLCCPKILSENLGMGAGYEAILDRLDQDPHVLIFVPFRPACDYIQADLTKRGYDVQILRGGVDDIEQAQVLKRFREKQGIIVATIQYAESWDADSCQTSYFLGYDLTVDQNEQAEGRTRRAISEHKFVTWGYIKTGTPIDQHFLGKLGDDHNNAKLILGRPEGYIQKLMGQGNAE